MCRRSIRIKRSIILRGTVRSTITVHTISLAGAVLIILLGIVLLFLVGPIGLLILILAGILLWYALGPGNRIVVGN